MSDVDLMMYIKNNTKIDFNNGKMISSYTLDYPVNNSMHSVVVSVTAEERNELAEKFNLDVDEQVYRAIFEQIKRDLKNG